MTALRCDFCGKETETVTRVAVDSNYDRLTVRHDKMYACPACSEKKERERRERLAKEAAAKKG
ncbi:MAG: hypothetical protein HY894_05785 [Deltaproteobacteria bacterium]|nr:hypothetical protein [Deltaproteobacteria bacterium]